MSVTAKLNSVTTAGKPKSLAESVNRGTTQYSESHIVYEVKYLGWLLLVVNLMTSGSNEPKWLDTPVEDFVFVLFCF